MAKQSKKARKAIKRVAKTYLPVAPEVIFADLQGSLLHVGPKYRAPVVTGPAPSFLRRISSRIGA